MSKQVVVEIKATVSGDGVAETVIQTVTLSSANAMELVANLASGRNQLFPGVSFSAFLMVPNANSAVAKTYDASSTVGGSLSPNQPTLVFVPTGTTSVYVNAANTDNGVTFYFWGS